MTIPLVRPNLVWDDHVRSQLASVHESGIITNGPNVSALEAEAAEYLGCSDVVAVGSATAGLMLCLRAVTSGQAKDTVVMPDFTFTATALAARWNGLDIHLVDSDPDTYAGAFSSRDSHSEDAATVSMPVHVFGVPQTPPQAHTCVIDAAHGLGAIYSDGSRVGTKGVAEVFSLSPTKILTAGEGGLVATNDTELAHTLRALRNYGNAGTYQPIGTGLNARMTEYSAVLARAGLPRVDNWRDERLEIVRQYQDALEDIPGVAFQRVPTGSVPAYKDCTIRIAQSVHGEGARSRVGENLKGSGVDTREYFNPVLHNQPALDLPGSDTALPVSQRLSQELLTLPMFNGMRSEEIEFVSEQVRKSLV
jgi:dTDP-4-amino-4,6-dideoxygalactose transaminase